MALAADYVVAEYDELFETGEIDPDHVMTPGMFIDALIAAEDN
jgi:acetate CoA/acetoacetate CoA-transferase alpha subunit